MRKSRRSTLAILALVLGTASLALADPAKVTESEILRTRIQGALDDEKIANGDGPEVIVEGNLVTLRGTVKSAWAKREAIERAMEIEGVETIEDELAIAFAESDEELAEAVAKKIRAYTRFTLYDDVNLLVEKGHVTLTGRVTMPYKSKEMGERVERILGVQSLTNELKTLPINLNDSRLRSALTYRIYGDSTFREYAFRANPPIHIIVERGRVSLTGAVRSEVERRKAEHIARSTFGVFSVENKLQVGG